MFDQTFLSVQAQTRRPWPLAVSVVLQTGLVATMLIAPLLHVPKLELPGKVQLRVPVELVALREKPKPLQPTPAAQTHTVMAPRPLFQRLITAPTLVPAHINPAPDAPEIPIAGTFAVATGTPLSSGLGEMRIAPPVTHQTAAPQPEPSAPIHVSGGVQAGNLIFGPKPVYPRIAVISRTQGTVHIQAIIERDGSIGHLQVLSGPPVLINAALDAVRQWRYKPTLLNGQPVEVVTEIDVNFALN